MILTTHDAGGTHAVGARLGAALFDGAVVCLHGPLGAGKTCLAQGIARGLGVTGIVPSPTYVLVAEYPDAAVPLRHADLYRLEGPGEVAALGLDERVGVDGAWVVEWPDRAPWLYPADRLDVYLARTEAGLTLELVPRGPRHAVLVAALEDPGA